MIIALFRTLLRATDLLLSPEAGECETPGELPISALAASKPEYADEVPQVAIAT